MAADRFWRDRPANQSFRIFIGLDSRLEFVSKSLISDSLMIRHTFSVSSRLVFTPIGYNFKYMYINMFIKNYSEDDVICAEFVRDLRLNNLDVDSTTREDMIYN